MEIQELSLPVEGGSLHALRFGAGTRDGGRTDVRDDAPAPLDTRDDARTDTGDDTRVVVALHGITASAMTFPPTARNLPTGWSLLALDLRGRGGSADLPGPYGMRRHAADVCRIVADLGTGPVVLLGHSMGAYVAVLAAATCPELFRRVVLVDGGLSAPLPEGADPDEVLAAVVGPALTRLRQTFPSEETYLDFFRAHPALTDAWNEDIEAYVRYDLTGPPGAMRSRVNEEAVREDGRDLLLDAEGIGAALVSLRMPILLLTAPSGMLGQPPGFLADDLVAYWRTAAPHLQIETVPGTNHYTLMLGPRGAATVAQRVADPATWPEPVAEAAG